MQQINEVQSYLRHKNTVGKGGGGKIYDISEVCEWSSFDRDSVARDASSIWQSKIERSEFSASIVSSATIKNCSVAGANIHGGTMENSVICAELVSGKVLIKDSTVTGDARVCHLANVSGVKFSNLTVKGTAVLRDWNQAEDEIFDGLKGYIARGVWTRPPLVKRMPFEITLTESIVDNCGLNIFVGCAEKPASRWLEIGDSYGASLGWSKEQIEQVRQTITAWMRDS